MAVFFELFANLAPLYVLIAIGFLAGRFFEIDRITLANLSIFIFLPVVIFGFVAALDFKPVYALLPFLVLFIQTVIGFLSLKVGQKIYGDNRANLLSISTAMGNAGYFGLPLVLFLFEAQWVGVYMFMLLGFAMYEASFGYYTAARGNFDVRTSLIKLAKFPTLYAIMAGLAFNFSGATLSDQFLTYWGYFKGAYVVVGMMIIGAALSNMKELGI